MIELEEHLKTHKDIETFPCDLCGKQFFLKWRLKKHIDGHDGKRFRHFLKQWKACPFVDIGCKFQHQASTLCTFQRCKNDVCQYGHYFRDITAEDNDGNKAVIDLDKGCDKVLAQETQKFELQMDSK